MSVKLTPLSEADAEEPESVDICNATWRAITVAAKAYGVAVEPWNSCHDGQLYTPDELREMADRIEQLKDTPEWLRWLADGGGAVLS